MADENKSYSQEEMDAAIKKAVDATLARATKGKVEQSALDEANDKVAKLEKEKKLAETLPKVKNAFKALGGKDNVFDDYFKKHEEELLNADEKQIEKTIKSTIEKTPYAFDNTENKETGKTGEDDKKGSLFIQ